MENPVYKRGMDILWVILVALLPVTSMPIIVRLVGSSSVAAPSGIFLAALLAFGVLPVLIKKRVLPAQLRLLVLFALAAVFSTLLSFFSITPPLKDAQPWKSALTALLPLAVGLGFYLAASVWAVGGKRLQWGLTAINWSGLAIILWSFLQVGSWVVFKQYPAWLDQTQTFLSVGKLYETRAAGFTLEPSWLANQLNMLYLPFWLAATLRRYSVYSFRILKLSLENILLAGGVAALALSFSRVGWLAFFLVAGCVIVWLNVRFVRWLTDPDRPGSWCQRSGSRIKPGVYRTLISLGLLLAYLAALVGAAWLFSRFDKRMATMFSFDASLQDPFIAYANELKFGERIVYWHTGWNIFSEHPLFGVGLGQAGYYFPQSLPSYGWYLEEVRQLMFHTDSLMNIKSLWIRLLAETGAAGFLFFGIWLISMVLACIRLARSPNLESCVVGWMGGLVLIGFILEGFSIDSFGLPYLWVSMGLVTAAYWRGENA